jgi:hypothetical protein
MSDVAGSLSMSKSKQGMMSGASALVREVAPSLSLDQIFEKHGLQRCALLKIDCEGAEEEIVRNTRALPRIDRICGELHYGREKDLEVLAYLERFVARDKLRFGRPGSTETYA